MGLLATILSIFGMLMSAWLVIVSAWDVYRHDVYCWVLMSLRDGCRDPAEIREDLHRRMLRGPVTMRAVNRALRELEKVGYVSRGAEGAVHFHERGEP